MNSRSNIYLKEAVSAIQKGHLTIEGASEKYGISVKDLQTAIKNYCLHGRLNSKEDAGGGLFSRLISRLTLKNIFSGIAPTYDCEKEIDRFKFKFTYAAASFLIVALGVATVSFPGYLSPADSTAKTAFEEKLEKTLASSSRREKAVDAEIKYLNSFYSRINKILEESDAKESKLLKEEVGKRLKYINAIEKDEIVKKNGDGPEAATPSCPRSQEIYANLYAAASAKGASNPMARMLKERIDVNYLKQGSKYCRPAAGGGDATAPAPSVSSKAPAAECKPASASAPKNNGGAPVQKREAAAASARAGAEEVKSFKLARPQAKNYESLKDKLYIINKYKREAIIKKSVVKKDLKFKYPVADMIFVPDRNRYNDSLKKIATNKDYNSRTVMITEDRG